MFQIEFRRRRQLITTTISYNTILPATIKYTCCRIASEQTSHTYLDFIVRRYLPTNANKIYRSYLKVSRDTFLGCGLSTLFEKTSAMLGQMQFTRCLREFSNTCTLNLECSYVCPAHTTLILTCCSPVTG